MYNIEDIRKVQLCVVDIFKQVVNVLEKMNIKYYGYSGTALGAVRHNGFIPWDDDLDIAIFREDYDRFLKEGQQYMPQNLFIQHIGTEPNYNLPFAKVRNTNTIFLEQNSKNLDINHGVFIDVFPIDNAPMELKEMEKLNKKIKLLKIQLSKGLTIEESFPKKIARKLITTFNMHDNKFYLEKFNKIATSVKTSDMAVIYGWSLGGYVPKCWFGEGVKCKFEDTTINLMTEYDKSLTKLYGDYMTPPPIEQQIPRHEPIEIKL